MRELETRLRAVGAGLAFPPEPDLAAGVRERLLRAEPPRPARRRLALALALLGAGALTAAVAVPQARTALLDLLGLRGATVERVETLPPVGPGAGLAPGTRVTFAEAQRAADFRVLSPRAKDGRRCGAVYLDATVPGGMVSIVCPAEGPQRLLLLTQFRGEHRPFVAKAAGEATRVEAVDVDGAPGLWLEGAPHVVSFLDAEGRLRERTRRLAGDVLLWERGGVTYRLEGALHGRDDALRIARDLR